MLDEEAKDAIAVLTRSGFYEPETIVEIVCEDLFEPGEADEAEVSAIVEGEFRTLEREKTTWPAVTDCDRLDQAFEAIDTITRLPSSRRMRSRIWAGLFARPARNSHSTRQPAGNNQDGRQAAVDPYTLHP